MRRHKMIRDLLRQNVTGMTTAEMSAELGKAQQHIGAVLRHMPDAYIKEYREERRRGRPARVWCVVVPPPNARPPEKKR